MYEEVGVPFRRLPLACALNLFRDNARHFYSFPTSYYTIVYNSASPKDFYNLYNARLYC